MPKLAMTLVIGATYNVKSKGPRTDPCGTPNSHDFEADCLLPTRMNCDRSFMYDLSHDRAWPVMPNVCSIRFTNVSLSNVSNAADRSSCSKSVLTLFSAFRYMSLTIRVIAVSVE